MFVSFILHWQRVNLKHCTEEECEAESRLRDNVVRIGKISQRHKRRTDDMCAHRAIPYLLDWHEAAE